MLPRKMISGLLLVALITAFRACVAEIPLITVEETTTFGQCLNTTDCLFFATEFSLDPDTIFCNAQTMRCTLTDGTVLSPTFQTPCDGVTLSTIVFPAVICGLEGDGLIDVTISAPTNYIHGVLRLFPSATVTPSNLTRPFLQEIFVNAPVTNYKFRKVFPGNYVIQYFHESGCFATVTPPAVINAFDNVYMNSSLYSGCDPDGGFTLLNDIVYPLPQSANFGLGIQGLLIGLWANLNNYHTENADVGAGQRVIYGHTFDMQGGIMRTEYGRRLRTSQGRLTFPFPYVFPSELQIMALSGYISMQFGIGYAYRATISSDVVFLQDYDGSYEGTRTRPVFRNLTSNAYINSTTAGYTLGPMRFKLRGIFVNVRLLYSDNSNIPNFSNDTLMTLEPVILVGPQGINSLCTSSTSSSLSVTLDYRRLLFPTAPVNLQIFKVNFTNAGQQLVADSPATVVINGIYTRTVSTTGFFCAVISTNLLDGRGFRPILQSCFQVGLATASITQLTSAYVQQGAGVNSPFPFTPYAGYGSVVRTSFYNTLPTTVVLFGDQTLVLQLFVLSNSTLDTEQLERFDGTVTAVFNDNQGTVPLSQYYGTSRAGDYTFYILKINVYFGNDFYFDRNAAASIVNTYAYTKLFIIAAPTSFVAPNPLDYSEGPGDATGDGQTNLTNVDVLYTCQTPAYINMVEALDLISNIIIENAVCPDQFGRMEATANGGFPFHMANSLYSITSLPPGARFPYTDPVTYYFEWTIIQTGQISYAGVGAYVFPAPSNQNILVTVIDAMGNRQQSVARADSIIPPGFTIITFNPQQPFCIDGRIQAVRLSYSINRPNDTNIIEYWAPLDPTARENYDPNTQFYDLPVNCSLTGILTPYQIYVECQLNGGVVNSTYNCTGCRRLPVQYPQAIGRDLISAVDSEWWEAIVWTQTTIFDFTTGRYVWCRASQSISTFIAIPLSLGFSTPVFLPNPPLACPNRACYSVLITTFVDPRFPGEQNARTLLSTPLLPALPASNTFQTTLGVLYNLTVFVADRMCPVTVQYTPTATGPIITNIRTTRTTCGSADGSVVIYVRYNDPQLSTTGTLANLCLFWPNRRTPAQAVNDLVPMPFQVATNAPRSTLLPNDNFVEVNRFSGIRGGVQKLLIYEACGGVGNDNGDCTSCLNVQTFTASGRRSVYQEFTISNFDDPAGGLQIERTNFTNALCCGDNYIFNFTFRDNAAAANQRYLVEFYLPFNLGVYQSWSQCTGPQTLPAPSPVGDFQVEWTGFNVVVPTCGVQGLGFSGNYTFIVKACSTGCVATFPTYIDAVNPFDITLSSAGTSCAYSTAQLVPSVIGGAPYQPYDNFTLVYMYPGSPILYFAPYQYCWQTPLNPTVWDCTFLQLNVQPGFYNFRACDRNQCCGYSNITVLSAPPIDVSIVGFDKVCETSNQSTVLLNVTGGVPPYYVLENITTVTTNDTISASFVATFNQTACFNILDSSGCVRPTEVCFKVPDPGPVNLTVVKTNSCKNVATGSVTVTSNQPITCRYLANNVSVPSIQTCTLVNLPASAFLTVIATTIIGCTAQESFQILARPPIVLTLIDRTENGILGGPCIDTINMTITGGDEPPPYIVALFDDMTNATLFYNGNNSIFITGVCRNFLYTIVAREGDGSCPVATVVPDPQFNFGSGGGAFPLLCLPTTNLRYFQPLLTQFDNKKPHLRWPVAIAVLVVAMFLILAIFGSVMWPNPRPRPVERAPLIKPKDIKKKGK